MVTLSSLIPQPIRLQVPIQVVTSPHHSNCTACPQVKSYKKQEILSSYHSSLFSATVEIALELENLKT